MDGFESFVYDCVVREATHHDVETLFKIMETILSEKQNGGGIRGVMREAICHVLLYHTGLERRCECQNERKSIVCS